jgi:hypothetical protein
MCGPSQARCRGQAEGVLQQRAAGSTGRANARRIASVWAHPRARLSTVPGRDHRNDESSQRISMSRSWSVRSAIAPRRRIASSLSVAIGSSERFPRS